MITKRVLCLNLEKIRNSPKTEHKLLIKWVQMGQPKLDKNKSFVRPFCLIFSGVTHMSRKSKNWLKMVSKTENDTFFNMRAPRWLIALRYRLSNACNLYFHWNYGFRGFITTMHLAHFQYLVNLEHEKLIVSCKDPIHQLFELPWSPLIPLRFHLVCLKWSTCISLSDI